MDTPTDEFLSFDVVIHGMFYMDDGYAAMVTYNRPPAAANDAERGPDETVLSAA